MPYRRSKNPCSATLKTALASKLSAQPKQGAWVHDHLTGETTYTADPARYLNNPLEHEGKPRFKVLVGKRNRSAKSEIERKPKRPKPTLYPIAGSDPSTGDKPTKDQAAHIDARLANSDPYFNIKQMVREPKRHFNKSSGDIYQGIAWLILKNKF